MSLRIVADEAIPFSQALFGPYADITLIPGHEINLSSIMEADALLVRSITSIDASLLAGSPVKFVGTATAGTDHVDTAFLESAGIRFAAAPGGNAVSVVEYVITALVELAVRTGESLLNKTVGIVGYGCIGSLLAARLGAMGIVCHLCDPPLQEKIDQRAEPHDFLDLNDLLQNCDVISLHVPVVSTGAHPTVGLMAEPEFSKMAQGSWLINTARGGVVVESDLLAALNNGSIRCVVTDVWSGEPNPDVDLVSASDISTAHIAGYSIDAKRRSTEMILNEFCRYFLLEKKTSPHGSVEKKPSPHDSDEKKPSSHDSDEKRLQPNDSVKENLSITSPEIDPESELLAYLVRILRQMYDIREDDSRLRAIPETPLDVRAAAFRKLRTGYPTRYGFERFHLDDQRLRRTTANMLQAALRINVVQAS